MSTQSLRFSPEDRTPQEVTLLNASASRYEGDWPSIPHSHAFTELFYVRDGQGEFLIEDNIFPISKDDLIIVNPHINHTEISRGSPPLSYFTVGVDGLCFLLMTTKNTAFLTAERRKRICCFILIPFFRNWISSLKGMNRSVNICWMS